MKKNVQLPSKNLKHNVHQPQPRRKLIFRQISCWRRNWIGIQDHNQNSGGIALKPIRFIWVNLQLLNLLLHLRWSYLVFLQLTLSLFHDSFPSRIKKRNKRLACCLSMGLHSSVGRALQEFSWGFWRMMARFPGMRLCEMQQKYLFLH